MVACDQCDEALPWPLRCGHTYVGIHSREYVRAAVAGPRFTFPHGDWQHVQIKAGNPRVVAIQFETADQATEFINTFAATASPTPADVRQVRCVHGVPEGLTCAICGPIRNDDPPTLAPPERTRVAGEQ